jgi:hypothetical protein
MLSSVAETWHSLAPLRLHTLWLSDLFPTLRVLISLYLLHLSFRFLSSPRPEYGRLFEHRRVRRFVGSCAAALVCGLGTFFLVFSLIRGGGLDENAFFRYDTATKETFKCFSTLDTSVRGFRVAWKMLKPEEWPIFLVLLIGSCLPLFLPASSRADDFRAQLD